MCDCTVDSDVGTGDFSLVLGILHVYGQAHVRSHVCPNMDCYLLFFSALKKCLRATDSSASNRASCSLERAISGSRAISSRPLVFKNITVQIRRNLRMRQSSNFVKTCVVCFILILQINSYNADTNCIVLFVLFSFFNQVTY